MHHLQLCTFFKTIYYNFPLTEISTMSTSDLAGFRLFLKLAGLWDAKDQLFPLADNM